MKFELARNTFLYAQLGYDHDIRNNFNKGIVNGGLGVARVSAAARARARRGTDAGFGVLDHG